MSGRRLAVLATAIWVVVCFFVSALDPDFHWLIFFFSICLGGLVWSVWWAITGFRNWSVKLTTLPRIDAKAGQAAKDGRGPSRP